MEVSFTSSDLDFLSFIWNVFLQIEKDTLGNVNLGVSILFHYPINIIYIRYRFIMRN